MAVALRELDQGHARRRPALRVLTPQPSRPSTPRWVFWLRRALVLLAAVALALGAFTAVRAVTADATVVHGQIDLTVVVPAGGTLWDLAERYAPADVDRSAWVLAVADRNDLDPGAILPGTPVSVPVATQRIVASPQRTSRR